MAKRLEKKTVIRGVNGHEVETELFIYHVKKLFPNVTAVEMRRFIAKYLGLNVGYRWLLNKMNLAQDNLLLLAEEGFEGTVEEFEKEKIEMVEKSVSLITDDSRIATSEIISDSQKMAKNIKGKMMDEIDIRLDSDTETFSNDELIRGSKIMHDIEFNTPENPPININFNIDKFNTVYNELNNKQKQSTDDNGRRKEVAVVDGEIQEG